MDPTKKWEFLKEALRKDPELGKRIAKSMVSPGGVPRWDYPRPKPGWFHIWDVEDLGWG